MTEVLLTILIECAAPGSKMPKFKNCWACDISSDLWNAVLGKF